MTVKRKCIRANKQVQIYRYGYWIVKVYDSGEAEWVWLGVDDKT